MNLVGIIMLVATIVTILIVLAIMLLGFFKGWKRSLLGLCRTLVAAIIAFFAVFIFCRVVPAGDLYELFEPLIGVSYISESEALQTMGGSIVYTILMPFVFSQLFLMFDLLLLIPAYFIAKALGIYTKKRKKTENAQPSSQSVEKTGYKGKALLGRFGGAGIELVTSLMVIIFVLLPFSGIVYTFAEGVSNISQTAKEQNINVNVGESDMQILDYSITDAEGKLRTDEVDRMADDMLDPIHYNIFVRLSYSTPVRAMCNAMTATTDATGQARNELAQIFDVANDALYFLVDPNDYGEEQKAAVDHIVEYFSKSDLHSEAAADLINIISDEMDENNGEALGDIDIILEPLFEILSNTTAESIKADLNTLRDIIITMIDYDMPATFAVALEKKSDAELINAFANEEFLYELFNSLYHNDDYRHMTGPVIDYVFTTVVRQFDPETPRLNVAVVDENYTDESIHTEARVFAKALADAKTVMEIAPALSGSNDAMTAIVNVDMKALGGFVDNARDSELIGDGVTEVLLTVLESPSFDSMREVSNILVSHINEDDDISMENLLETVQQTVSIMHIYEDTSSITDTAELAKSLKSLNESCDERTSVILKEIIDDSNILNAAILSSDNEQKNESASKVLNVMLDKLTTGEYTEEQMETEAKAVDYTMKLVQASSNNDIKDICSEKEEYREMIETIDQSEIASSALIEMAYQDGDPTKELTDDALSIKNSLEAEDVENIRTECKEYYQELVKNGEDTTQTEINLKALSAIFDGNISDAELAAWAAEAKNN